MTLLHLVRKDLRHRAAPLVVLATWHVAQVAVLLRAHDVTQVANVWRLPLGEITLALVVGLVVLADPPARRQAFHRLLPVSPGRWLVAKLTIIALTIVVLAGLHACVAVRLTSDFGIAPLVFAEAAWLLAAVALPAAAVAALVSGPIPFALVGVGLLVVAPRIGLGLIGVAQPSSRVQATQVLLCGLVAAVGGLAVWAAQLAWRSRGRSVAIAGGALVAFVLAGSAPVDLLPRPAWDPADTTRLTLDSPAWTNDLDGARLQAGIRLDPRPPGVLFDIAVVETEVRLADGRTVRSHGDGDRVTAGCRSAVLEALVRSGRPVHGVAGPCPQDPLPRLTLVGTAGADWTRDDVVAIHSRFQATVGSLVVRSRSAQEVAPPLRFRVVPNALEVVGNGLRSVQGRAMLLTRGEVALGRLPEPVDPVLYHRERQTLAHPLVRGAGSNAHGFVLMTQPFVIDERRIDRVLAGSTFDGPPYEAVDAAWFVDAELVSFRWRTHGRASWTVSIEDPAGSTVVAAQPSDGDRGS